MEIAKWLIALTVIFSIIGCDGNEVATPQPTTTLQPTTTMWPTITHQPTTRPRPTITPQPTAKPKAANISTVADADETCEEARKRSQTNLVNSIYKIRANDQIGTSFLLERNEQRYLITAKHFGIHVENQVDLYWKGEWEPISVQVVNHSEDDTTVLSTDIDIGRIINSAWTSPNIGSELYLENEVRMYGFIFGQSTWNIIGSPTPGPTVKSGIVAGHYTAIKDSEHLSFLIDGRVHPGFSGGPVASIQNCEYFIVAVINRYVPSEVKVLSLQEPNQVIGTIQINTGMTEAENIQHAMQIVAEDQRK